MTISTRNQILQNMAAGKGVYSISSCKGVTPTAGAAASGYFTSAIQFNGFSTLPGTLYSIPGGASGLSNELFLTDFSISPAGSTAGSGAYLARLYRIGGVSLTATGNRFTHDAATFPLTRTNMGTTSNVNLIPMAYVTTALTTTAGAFILKDSGGTAGYTNQAGSNIVGTKTFTFPSATTAAGSGYMLRLEDGDSAVQDIIQVNVTTSSAAGAFDIYGAEVLALISTPATSNTVLSHHDALYGSLMMRDINPATPTSGSVTSYLAVLPLGNAATTATSPTLIMGVNDV